jgi:hypothetical protein
MFLKAPIKQFSFTCFISTRVFLKKHCSLFHCKSFLLQIASEERVLVEQELGTRLGKTIVKSCQSISQNDEKTESIPVERIVRDNIIQFASREVTLARKAKETLLVSAIVSTSSISRFSIEIVDMIRAGACEFEEKTIFHCKNLLKLTATTLSDATKSTPISYPSSRYCRTKCFC